MKDNIIFKLTTQRCHGFRQRDDLPIDDEKNTWLIRRII
jgi:hypothetical protein